jgi:CDP-glucose 4,6-dehydratase
VGKRQAAVENLVSAFRRPNPDFWRNRRVFLTGHTGFKGAWAALWLKRLGAEIHGFALPAEGEPSLWREVGSSLLKTETLANICDRAAVESAVMSANPQIVLHMAAQSLVRPSFADPVGTITTNAMGTVHLLEALRGCDELAAVLIVTTDKVYMNDDSGRDYVEGDPLGGHDPYSASKAAAEILTRSYATSYFDPKSVPIGTARAGNVIGGGDWSADRLVPDVWRAARAGVPLRLRAPNATRPWQHVLEPISGYFLFLEELAGDPHTPRSLNFGPPAGRQMTVGQVASAISEALGVAQGWIVDDGEHPPEMKLLSLDPSLARKALGWHTQFDYRSAIQWTAEWYEKHLAETDTTNLCLDQIERYEALV